MELMTLLQSAAALIFVLCLIGLVSYLLRRYGSNRVYGVGKSRAKKRLSVVEAVILDNRRKLLLVKRDDTEHLLLIGDGETVIESYQVNEVETHTWKVEE